MFARAEHLRSIGRGAAAMAVAATVALFAVQAIAAQPEVAKILEPAVGIGALNPGDVHMVAEFSDEDGGEHVCSDWEIRLPSSDETAETVWRAECAGGAEKTHIHLGDGEFVNSYGDPGRDALEHLTSYYLWVRFKDDSGDSEEWSEPETRPFETAAPNQPGSEAQAWQAREGFVVEKFAEGFQLPVNIAMVPDPGPEPSAPLMYVAELYGNIKVILRDRTVRDYATGLLNFNPTGNFPGSGEIGLAGIVVEPESGDLFVSMMQREGEAFHPKVARLFSDEHGFEATNAATPETVLYMSETVQGASHQVSNLTISPDSELFVNNGDGGSSEGANEAPDPDSFLGKVLRMTLDGEPFPGNPYFTNDSEPFTARDYVYATGFRNPFGGAWRLSDGTHWEVENGPAVDRLAKVEKKADYGWPADSQLRAHAAYNWEPSHAPVNIDFVELEKHLGSGFPSDSFGHAFVTESGPTYAPGPQKNGKRVVEFGLGADGELLSGPETLAEYTGVGRATAVGLAAGPEGLYFTDLYKDVDADTPIDRGANVLLVRYCGGDCPGEDTDPTLPPPLQVDRTPPQVRKFRLQRRVFAVRGAKPGSGKAAARYGTVFLYRLSERATVRIRIRRLNRRGPRVVLKAPGRAGPNRRPFGGRIGRRPLPPGRYRATIWARDPSGNASRSKVVSFRIVLAGRKS